MKKLLVLLFFGIFFLQGYSSDSSDSSDSFELEMNQREKEQQMLTKFQEDFFRDSVTFDEDSKTFIIVSDYHLRAFTIAKRGEGLEMRNGNVISWECYISHYIGNFFAKNESGSLFSYGITYNLGKGYTVKEITSYGEIVFIAKDGRLIYDIINGYANEGQRVVYVKTEYEKC